MFCNSVFTFGKKKKKKKLNGAKILELVVNRLGDKYFGEQIH